MQIPLGFDDESVEGKVCRLKKLLYGLKQSSRAWFERFTKYVRKIGYTQA